MRSGEKRPEEAIAAAFDQLPEPDPTKLKVLEERLGRQTSRAPRRARPRWTYWWLILGLAATGAAAWWGGGYWSDSKSKANLQEFAPAAAETMERAHERGRTESRADAPPENVSPQPDTNSQTIYRREVY